LSTPANNLPELPEGYRVEPVEPTPTQPGPATSRLPALPDGYRLEEPRALAGAAAQPSDDSQFTKGLKSGIDQTQGLLYGLAGLAGSAVGSKDLESWGLEGYQRNVDEAAQNAGRVSSVTDIRSGADFLDWSAYTLGNLVPTMAVLIGGGGIGGAIGKQAAKQGVKSYLSKALGEKAGRTVNEAALKRLATRALDKGVRRGQMAGAFAGSSGLEAGGIFADTVEENGQTHPGVAAAFGVLAGALDAIPVINLFDNWGIGREVKGAILKNLTQGKWGAATKKVLEQAALEGSTEGVQTVVERAAAKFVDDNKDIFSDEGWNEIINASAAGGLMGGVMGVPAGVIAHRQAGQPEAPPAPEIPERGTDLAGGESEDLLGAGDTALGAEEITIEDTLANAPGIDVQELSPEQVDVTRPLDTEGIDVTELQTQDLTAAPPPPDTAGIDVTELSAQDVAAAEPPVEPVDTTGIDVAELPLQETQPAAAPAEQVPTAGIDVAELTTEPAAAAPASVEDAIDQAAAEAATSPDNDLPEPTEAQKKAGNYKKGHVQVHGLDISIENPAGSKRRPEWPDLTHDYGYIRRTEGNDGDQVDVFLGPDPQSETVYVVDQRNPKTGAFDEHKAMVGFDSEQAAREGYLSNYGKGWKGMRGITAMSVDEFKDWLKNGDTKKPVGQSDTFKRVKARNAKKKGEEVPHTDDDRDMQVAEPAATPPRKPKPETSTDEVPFTDDGRDVPTEATDNAETVRSDEGQVRGRGNESEKRQEKGGTNLQRDQEKERAEAESEAQAPKQEKGWKRIGANSAGEPLYEDHNGVRSITDGGIRITESVGIVPGRGIIINKEGRDARFLTATERDERKAQAEPAEPAPAKPSQKTPEPAPAAPESGKLETEGETTPPQEAPDVSVERAGETALEGVSAEPVRTPAGRGPAERGGREGGDEHAPGYESAPGDSGADVRRGVGSGEGEVSVPAAGEPATRGVGNYRITEADELGRGGVKTKFAQNVAAIRLAKELVESGQPATLEQQKILAKYVGWGGMPQAFPRPDGSVAKGWEKQAEELREVLSDEEYAAARRSTQDAHYTSPTVVGAIYNALARFGFTGGKVLEPSVGTGNFLGLTPSALRSKARWTGIELDPLTSKIAQLLYPKADIINNGFQDVAVPSGSFDLVIGNPPFGSQRLFDPNHKDISKFSIHNFFFAKSIEATRPGGLIAMVVSNYMLDSTKAGAREYMGDKVNFLGAIRLPNTAFKENAGTEVTTDIIFLQKRGEGVPVIETAWTHVGTVEDPAGGEAITLNEYFVNHPDMMLGEMRREGSMYAKDSAALIAPKDQDLAAELEAAVAKLPANAMDPVDRIAEEPAPQPAAPGEIPETTKVWGLFVGADGEIMERTPDELDKRQARPAVYEDSKGNQRPFSESEKKRVRDLIGLANAVKELIAAERSDAKDIEAKRKKLNRLYDAHVKKFGLLHSQGTKLVFEGDPEYPLLLSLERGYERAVSPKRAKQLGTKPRKARADKADIFTKRVNLPYREITRVDDADSALKVSLNQRGKVDVDYMAQLSGQDPERIIKDLAGRIYLDPVAGWVTADEYLSGNVKAKLAQAKEQTDPRFAANIEALEKVQPDDVEPVDISVRLGAPWIPAEDMQDFITHLLQIPSHAQYSTLTGTWIVKLKGRPDRTRNHEMWGIEQMGASRIIDNVVNNRPVRVTYRDSNGSTIVDQEATAELNAKADAIRQEFLEWVWKDEDRRDRLARLYNDTFNHSIQRRYDGSHLTLPGMNATITLRQHQKDVIWRAIQEGRLLMDHVVGAGKTFAAIAVGMEMRRLGLANKPMYVVPNHLVEQWAADFQRLYPGANVLAATKNDFQKQNRRKFFSRIATGDYDAIIVAHSSFKFIPTPLDEYQAFLEEQIKDLVAAIEEMEEAGESKRTVKQLEKMKETLENKIKKAMEDRGSKDDVVDMGEMGVDSLIVDEAHLFKNLFFATKRARQGISVTESERATDLFVKVRTLQKKNSGRGAYFLTGTPISNSISEMFTMQRYLDYATLQQQGITHFDAWADTFANFTTAFEISSTGQGLSLKTRLSEFTNVPELMTMYGQFADVITMEDLERQAAARGKRWPVPKVKGGKPENLIVPISTEQSAYMMEIVHRAENLDPRDPQKDNMLKITNDARKAALDMRLIDPGIEDNPDSKTSTAANRIFDLYTRWKKDRGTQLVFIDLSTPKSARSAEQRRIQDLVARARDGDETAQAELEKVSPDDILALSSVFDVYNDLKDKLIAKGVHEGEIAFIHDAKTEKQKEDLMEQVRAGNVRILLGSTSKMGAGMNVQDKLIALHHLDAPWRPSDLEQREGRIVRQGNEFYERDPDGFEIEIVRYATERTYDSRMWQTIERKAKFIGQLRKAQAGVRVVEDIGGEAANAAEMKAAATGNPLILEQVDLDHKVRQLEIRKKQHTRSQHRLQQTISRLEADGGPASRAAEKKKIVQANIATRDQNTPKNDKGERVFTATINGKTLDTHTKAGKALKAAVAKFLSSKGLQRGTRETIGSYRGFDVLAGYRGQTSQGYDGITVDIATAEGHKNVMWTDTNGLKEMADVEAFKILDRYMKEWDNALEEIDDRASREKAELATAKEEIKKPFKDKEELEKAKKRLAEVTAELTKKDEDKKPGEPDVARSQREPATSLATADAVRETLRDMFGKRADRFTVVQSTDDLPNKWGVGFSGTIGLAEKSTGAIYLVADNIDVMDRAGLYGVILHEIFHVAMSKDPRLKAHMDRFTAKLAEMRRRALAGEDSEAADFYRVANALVPKNTPKELDLEEFAAYALQVWEKPTTSIPEAISKLIKDLVAAIRMALVRAGLYRPKDITPADLSALARSWFRREDYVSVEGEQLSVSSDRAKSVIARATRRTAPSRQLTPEQQAAMEKHAPQAPRKPIRQRIMEMKQDFGLKVSQGIFDQYASLKNLSEKAWMLARQTHSVSGAVEAAFTHGKLKLDRSGAIDVDTNGQGLAQALRPLGEELDHFLMWIAGNRSDRLNRRSATATRMAKDRINQAKQLEAQARRLEVGATRQQVQQKKALRKQATRLRNEAKALEDIASVRERLFTDQEVAALKTLNRGTMADGRNRAEVYRTALAELNAFQKSVLDIAEQTGTIDPQERARWDEDFYVPFYRLLQEEGQKVRGPSSLRSLVNQTAYKRLKGADIPLNDLLSNVLMNWSHLLSASLRNQAATEALTQANRAGIATPIRAHQAGKGSVFIRVAGQKQYFDVDDELVLEALTALNWEGFNNPAMQMMRKFKRGFTIGVTASPEFRIANLLRDTIHAAAVTPLSYNLIGNVLTGAKGTSPKGLIRARMLAGGGEMHFGHLYAADPEAAKLRIQKGIQEHTVLNNPEAFKTFRGAVKTMWDSWAELGSRVENVNRAALFQQVLDRGGSLLEANFAARDLMDFSVHGAWPAIRFLVQAVPFLNARLQGLHKMGRAVRDHQQRKQFVAVTGAVMMVSALLYLLFRDDDDFKQREDWDRDNYWWFKLPGSDYQFRLPKPFEVGALGTLAERVVEQIVDDEAHGDLFAERLGFMLHQTFAFSAVPQMFQPILDIYANKDPFTKRPIESMSMERLSPTERRRVWTTQTGIAASLAMDRISWGKVVLSPVQIDYLVEGYFGWLGASALAGVDLMARPATGAPVRPAKQIQDYPVIGRFVRENPNRHSKYVTTFYEQLQEIEQAYADIRAARKVHDTERAKSLREKHKDLLKNKARYTRAQRQLRQINNQITILHANDSMDAAAKRTRLDELTRRKNEIAERVVEYGQ